MDKIDGTSEEDEDEEMAVAMEVKEEEEDDDDEDADDGVAAMRRASQQLLHHNHQPLPAGARRSRPKEEKERTKLRERHRRAITARILAGLRRHGNYNLRVRADINDVIAALAREAGWVVLPDGTTFPSRSGKPSPLPPPPPQSPAPLRGIPSTCNSSRLPRMKSVYLPPDTPRPSFPPDGADDKPLATAPERDFAGTPYVPIYVALPLGVVDANCELSDPVGISKQLRMLKSINVDGIVVDCWWGIVEAHSPQQYNWTGYKHLFAIVRELKLKIRVAMSFHECAADGACIPLPQWVVEIGTSNLDIFFTDREGRRNSECLSWGIDKERALRGRTAVEVYFDYMRSFRVEFDEFFDDGIISGIQIGLGPCGELRYPSCTTKHGWSYPGIGEFQCYDQYLLKSLRRAAEARGHSFWARGPDNAGAYISQPHETGFFCDGGEYDGYYGRFFLGWYSTVLVVHGDRVLSLAKLAFEGTPIFAKVSGIHWWYRTASHAAELTAGFYNPCNRDGYAAIAAMLKKHDAVLNFTCAASLRMSEDFQEGLADPEGLVWQVLNAAWDVDIPVASENPLPCHDRDGYNKILENAKPYNDPDGRHLSAFTYLRLGPVLTERHNFLEFQRFVKRMHGEAVLDLQV